MKYILIPNNRKYSYRSLLEVLLSLLYYRPTR